LVLYFLCLYTCKGLLERKAERGAIWWGTTMATTAEEFPKEWSKSICPQTIFYRISFFNVRIMQTILPPCAALQHSKQKGTGASILEVEKNNSVILPWQGTTSILPWEWPFCQRRIALPFYHITILAITHFTVNHECKWVTIHIFMLKPIYVGYLSTELVHLFYCICYPYWFD